MSPTREAFRTQWVKIQPRQSSEKFKFNNKPTYTTDMGATYCGDSRNLVFLDYCRTNFR